MVQKEVRHTKCVGRLSILCKIVKYNKYINNIIYF